MLLLIDCEAASVPGWKIQDNLILLRCINDFVKDRGSNLPIVNVDQKVAVDRIIVSAFWRVLTAFNIPPTFIDMVRTVYNAAECINGPGSLSIRSFYDDGILFVASIFSLKAKTFILNSFV